MAIYTKNDVQNAFADIRNGLALATAKTRYGIPRNTLHRYLGGIQSCRHVHENKQRLLIVQEQNLKR